MTRRLQFAQPRWRPLDIKAWLLLPALVALAVYACTLDGYFLSDDFGFLRTAGEAHTWREALHLRYSSVMLWLRPIVDWSFWLQWPTNGLDPLGYRLFNVVLHALNCVGVAWLAGVLGGSRAVGAVAGLAFALLPIHPESVVWIAGRSDLLCASGLLVALLAWTRFCAEGGKARHLVLACFGLAFGLLSKEMAVPGVALLAGVSVGFFRASWRRQLGGLAILTVITVGYLILRVQLLGGVGGMATEGGTSMQALVSPSRSAQFLVNAVRLVTVPMHQDFFSASGQFVELIPMAGWLVLILGGCVSSDRSRLLARGGAVAGLFLVSILPVVNWAGVDVMFGGSRYLYVPSIFSALGLGMLVMRSTNSPLERGGRKQTVALLSGLLMIFGAWGFQLMHMNHLWNQASAISRRTLASVLPPVKSGRLSYTGLRQNFHGAHVLRNNFGNALLLFTEWGADTRELEAERWQFLRSRAKTNQVEANLFQRWQAEEQCWTTEPFDAR